MTKSYKRLILSVCNHSMRKHSIGTINAIDYVKKYGYYI